jgi:Ca2+-binding EF-hand superfamily protein
LNKAFLKLGKKFSEDEVAKMIRAVDTDKNGMVKSFNAYD